MRKIYLLGLPLVVGFVKRKFSSSSQFECEDGKIMSGVTLKGKVQ